MAPCRTRNRGVTEFHKEVLLFPNLMGDVIGGLQFIENGGRDEKSVHIDSISSGVMTCIEDTKEMVEMEVHFWSSKSQSQRPKFTVPVRMPSWWTARIYVSALLETLK